MPHRKTVLVTGVGDQWGSRLAARLLTLPDIHVIGTDTILPKGPIKGLDFIQADIRDALVLDLLQTEKVETICHLAFRESERPSEAAFDLNVMGAMKIFGAAAAAGVKKIVLKSSTAVYGARSDNSAFLVEERSLTNAVANGTLRDLVEIEAFCNGFRGQYPDIALTVLRFPSIVGPHSDTPMTRFLSSQSSPTLMGFDPMMQVIHEDDVVEALAHAVLARASGLFNVAAEGVLPLSKLMAVAGRLALPVFHLAAYWGNPLLSTLGVRVGQMWPLGLDYIRYPWVADLSKMRNMLAFAPRYTAIEALREFAERKRLQQFSQPDPEVMEHAAELREIIEGRRQAQVGPARASELSMGGLSDDAEEEIV